MLNKENIQIFHRVPVIKTHDPDWIRIRIGIQPKMLDPHPDSINLGPKHCKNRYLLSDPAKNLRPKVTDPEHCTLVDIIWDLTDPNDFFRKLSENSFSLCFFYIPRIISFPPFVIYGTVSGNTEHGTAHELLSCIVVCKCICISTRVFRPSFIKLVTVPFRWAGDRIWWEPLRAPWPQRRTPLPPWTGSCSTSCTRGIIIFCTVFMHWKSDLKYKKETET